MAEPSERVKLWKMFAGIFPRRRRRRDYNATRDCLRSSLSVCLFSLLFFSFVLRRWPLLSPDADRINTMNMCRGAMSRGIIRNSWRLVFARFVPSFFPPLLLFFILSLSLSFAWSLSLSTFRCCRSTLRFS